MDKKQPKCPVCKSTLSRNGQCIQCRNEKILEACIKHSKDTKLNHVTAKEFEDSKYMKDIWKESGLARILNPILLVLNQAIKDGVYTKEVVDLKHYFILSEETGKKTKAEPKPKAEPKKKAKKSKPKKEAEVVEDIDDIDEAEIEDMKDAINEVLDEELEEFDDSENETDEYELLKQQFEEETGLSAITTRGTERKDFLKWKEEKE